MRLRRAASKNQTPTSMNMKHHAVILFVTLAANASAWAAAKPLQVFILAGHSNMQGHARLSTFEPIGMDPVTRPMLAEMLGADVYPAVNGVRAAESLAGRCQRCSAGLLRSGAKQVSAARI